MLHATSDTHPIRVDVIPTDHLPGRLGVTFAPGKKDASGTSRVRWDRDLATDLRDLRERFGTDMLVPLLRRYEYELLGVPDLVARAEAQGMRVRAFEIDDGTVPSPGDDRRLSRPDRRRAWRARGRPHRHRPLPRRPRPIRHRRRLRPRARRRRAHRCDRARAPSPSRRDRNARAETLRPRLRRLAVGPHAP